MKWLVNVLLAGFLCGCASTPMPTPEEVAAADCGLRPENYQAILRNYFDYALKDPESAKYKFLEPVKNAVRAAPIEGGKMYYAWLVGVNVNAKNSYGGYTGYQFYRFMVRDGKIVGINAPPGYYWTFIKGIPND